MLVLAVIVRLAAPLPWTATVGPVVVGLEQPSRQSKLYVSPVGMEATLRVTLPVKPFTPATVILETFEEPCLTLMELGLGVMVKSAIFTVTVVRWVWAGLVHSPPEEQVPVTFTR